MINLSVIKHHYIGVLCFLTVFLTVFSQVPDLHAYIRPVVFGIWILLLLSCVVLNNGWVRLNRFAKIYAFVLAILLIECALCTLFEQDHMHSHILSAAPLPFLCYMVGILVSRMLDKRQAALCLVIYLITTTALFVYIYFEFIGNVEKWLDTDSYLYGAKNSAGQIAGSAIILSYFLLKIDSKFIKFVKWSAISILLIGVLLIGCRTVLLGLIVSTVVYLNAGFKFRKRILILMLFFAIFMFALRSDQMLLYINKSLFINKRKTESLDGFSSGRLSYYQEAWQLFQEHVIVGTGNNRVDNFYLLALSDVGIIGTLPVVYLLYIRFLSNIRHYNHLRNAGSLCLLCLTFFYVVESFLEGGPPFGPGTCCFMFWVLCAFEDEHRLIV